MYEKKKKGIFTEKKPENKTSEKNDELKALVAEYVKEALEEAKSDWDKDFEEKIASEREDAIKLASMSKDERAKFEIEKREKDFESERQQYISERAEFEAAKELEAQNLPVAFARMVADSDKDVMLENISVFKKEYMKAIEAGLSGRLKGSLPRISKEKQDDADPFLNGLGM